MSSIKANWEKMDEESTPKSKRRLPITRALAGDIVQFIDFVLVIFASVLVALVYHDYILISAYEVDHYLAAGIIGGTALTAMLRRDGYYEFDVLIARRTNLRPVSFALGHGGVYAAGLWFCAQIFRTILTLLVFCVVRRGAGLGGHQPRRRRKAATRFAHPHGGFYTPHCGCWQYGRWARAFANIFATLKRASRLLAFIALAMRLNDAGSAGDLSDLLRKARAGEIDDVVIALPHMETSPA